MGESSAGFGSEPASRLENTHHKNDAGLGLSEYQLKRNFESFATRIVNPDVTASDCGAGGFVWCLGATNSSEAGV